MHQGHHQNRGGDLSCIEIAAAAFILPMHRLAIQETVIFASCQGGASALLSILTRLEVTVRQSCLEAYRDLPMSFETGVMQRLSEVGIQSAWDKVLELQTLLLGPSELTWLRHHHAFDHEVLEVGSGKGHYGTFLANANQQQLFWGLEASKAFFDNRFQLPRNYRIQRCRVGDDPLPDGLCSRCKTCVVRFVLQHSPKPLELLSSLYDALPKGARLFIIEEDDRLFMSHGTFPEWDKAVQAWKRACSLTGTNSQVGLALPFIVRGAGFIVDDFSINLRHSLMAPNDFFSLFSLVLSTFKETLPGLMSDDDFAAVRGALNEEKPKGFIATYPQVLLVARK